MLIRFFTSCNRCATQNGRRIDVISKADGNAFTTLCSLLKYMLGTVHICYDYGRPLQARGFSLVLVVIFLCEAALVRHAVHFIAGTYFASYFRP